MSDQDDRLATIIAAYRAARRPTTDARTAYRLLMRRVHDGDWPRGSTDTPTDEPSERHLSWSKPIWAMALVAAAVFVVVTAATPSTSRWWSARHDSLQASHVADGRDARISTAGGSGSTASEPVASASHERRSVDTNLPQATKHPARSKPRAGRVTAKSAPAVARGDLGAEMQLLDRGQSALISGDPARALRYFDRHARSYPDGVLAEERMVKRMVALCELGRGSEARAEAQAFVAAHPSSPLTAHAATICRNGVDRARPGDGK